MRLTTLAAVAVLSSCAPVSLLTGTWVEVEAGPLCLGRLVSGGFVNDEAWVVSRVTAPTFDGWFACSFTATHQSNTPIILFKNELLFSHQGTFSLSGGALHEVVDGPWAGISATVNDGEQLYAVRGRQLLVSTDARTFAPLGGELDLAEPAAGERGRLELRFDDRRDLVVEQRHELEDGGVTFTQTLAVERASGAVKPSGPAAGEGPVTPGVVLKGGGLRFGSVAAGDEVEHPHGLGIVRTDAATPGHRLEGWEHLLFNLPLVGRAWPAREGWEAVAQSEAGRVLLVSASGTLVGRSPQTPDYGAVVEPNEACRERVRALPFNEAPGRARVTFRLQNKRGSALVLALPDTARPLAPSTWLWKRYVQVQQEHVESLEAGTPWFVLDTAGRCVTAGTATKDETVAIP